jgi:pantoate--beta-alanine ligase
MNIVTQLNEWQNIRRTLDGKTIGFIPTMGCLHAGHLDLCKRSIAENDITIVSIFVNPAQFNDQNDFNKYPRTQENDAALLQQIGVDYLLEPAASAMYPDQYQIQVTETEVSTQLEGEHRPGHFNGMLTVVLKLLNLTQATRAYFGEKDFQQLMLVKKMVAALFLPVQIISCDTVRAADGLALSSRNTRLSPTHRQQAAQFPALLNEKDSCANIAEKLTSLGFRVDYIVEKWQRRLGAVWLGDVRLIDNIPIKE